MSAPLTLGAAAALAGLAALSRRGGSRSAEGRSTVHLERRSTRDIHRAMKAEDEDFVAVEVFEVGPDGGTHQIQGLRLFYLFDENVEYYATMGDEFDADTVDEWLGFIDEAIDYFNGRHFPMRVYRGLRYSGASRPRLEHPGESWTPEIRVAQSFADGHHVAASGGDVGHILTARLMSPSDVDWEATLALYIAFTAVSPGPGQAEHQIRPTDEDVLQDVEVY